MPRLHPRRPVRTPVPGTAAPTASAHLRTQEDFSDALYRATKDAPWVLASVAVHGAVFLAFLLLPAPPADPAAEATRVAMAPPDVPDVLPEKEDPPEVEPEDEEIPREHESEVPLDAPPSPNEGPPGHDEEDEPPAGEPEFAGPVDFEALATNPVIGVGPGASGPWGLRGKGPGGPGGGGGAPARTRVATDHALDWLARHQSPSGAWDCDGFGSQCTDQRCSGAGEPVHDVGVTGLALLCFLGQGDTHVSGEHKEIVKRGLKFLSSVQDAEGCFGPRTHQAFQYDHSIAALAMIEAYGMTQSSHLRSSAEAAVGFIQRSRNPYLAWRYGVRDGDNDTSVTGWMVMALKSARMAGLDVEAGAFRDAVVWVDRMTEPEFGKVGYQQRGGQPARTAGMEQRFPASESEAMTAVGVLTRVFCGEDPAKSPIVQKGVDLLMKKLPTWDPDGGKIDMYYWYYGTLAAFQVGGDAWKKWARAMETSILDHQRTEVGRCAHGSWDPEDPWSPEGGRVYSTALMTLCLEVYHRYPRVFVGSGAGSDR